jgi:hypothetical protein
MQIGPPFSRRRSPNRPSPYSIEAIASSRESMENSRNQPRDGSARCVNTIALKGGGRPAKRVGWGSRNKLRICGETGPPPGAFGATLPLSGGGNRPCVPNGDQSPSSGPIALATGAQGGLGFH